MDGDPRRARRLVSLFDAFTFLLILALGGYIVHLHRRIALLEAPLERNERLSGAALLPMPARDFAGKAVTVPSGRKRLIFYLTPRCSSCTENMPIWASLSRQVGAASTMFLVVDGGDAVTREMPPYLRSYDLHEASVIRLDPQVMYRHGMFSVPRTILVGADGTVKRVWRGSVAAEKVIEAWKSVS